MNPGNRVRRSPDHKNVHCEDCREQLSARLDGEDRAELRSAVDAHLESCAPCRAWQDDAARVTRLARTTTAHATPDLVESVLNQAQRIRGSRTRTAKTALRVLLAALGLGQVSLGAAQLLGQEDPSGHGAIGGATLTHFSHEFAAWNIALGIGFVWIALRTGRALGLVPTLAAFVLLLTALEAVDLVRGHADPGRLASHTIVLAALVVVLVLTSRRLGGDGFAPLSLRGTGERGSARVAGPVEPPAAGHGRGLSPTGHSDAA